MKALIAFALLAASGAAAQPVHLVVPFPPGGNVDIVARIVAQGLTEETKTSVIVENRAGANAIIGADYVARAAPDGRTLLFATAETHAINPNIHRKLSYEPLKDFVSVAIVDQFTFSLVVSPKLPVASLSEFVAYAKKNDGRLNYASWGNGSISQIAFEQLKQSTGINLVHVPFQGAGPAITAVAAGNVEAFIVPLSVARPQAASGRVKLLAVTSAKREDSAPEVPTATEQGVPVVITGWHVLAAPRGTPQSVVLSLNRSLNAVTARSDIREKLLKAGVQPATSTPEEAQAMVRAEWQRWGAVAKTAGITAD